MNAVQTHPLSDHLAVILPLSALLQKLEHSEVPVDPAQYRFVVERLTQALMQAPSDARLGAVLDAHPAAAELYENLHYSVAGLCRSPLEKSVEAEQRAREMIGRLNVRK